MTHHANTREYTLLTFMLYNMYVRGIMQEIFRNPFSVDWDIQRLVLTINFITASSHFIGSTIRYNSSTELVFPSIALLTHRTDWIKVLAFTSCITYIELSGCRPLSNASSLSCSLTSPNFPFFLQPLLVWTAQYLLTTTRAADCREQAYVRRPSQTRPSTARCLRPSCSNPGIPPM